MRRLWRVLLGRDGEFEERALEDGLLTVHFDAAADFSRAGDRESVLAVLRGLLPKASEGRLRNYAAQLNQFINAMQMGDLVVVPLRSRPGTIAIAEVTGPYRQGEGGFAARPVRWLARELPRSAFRQDLLFSFGAFMTVCEVQRNNALARVEAVLHSGRDPGDGVRIDAPAEPTDPEEAEEPDLDLVALAREQIEARIASSFAGHDLTRLVAAILEAQGYRTHMSPPGPDNGIDIVAGRGPLGVESPRLVVQVKSGNTTVDAPTLQSLKGCIRDTGADHGLLVSWGGFRRSVEAQTAALFFEVKLWDSRHVVDALLEVYDRLPAEIRAELPLRSFRALAPDEP